MLPVLAALVLPGAPTPRTDDPADLTRLAMATQSTLLEQADRYRRLESELAQRSTELAGARQTEQAAALRAEAERSVVGTAAAALYRAAPGTRTLSAAATGVADTAGALSRAAEAGAVLEEAARGVAAAEERVAAVAARAESVLARSRARTVDLDPAVVAGIAGLGSTPSAGQQQNRNQRAVARWQRYLTTLAEAGIEPPAAADLLDPARLPAGLSPALDEAGEPLPGIAWAVVGNSPITVLPAETMTAVSGALSQVGKPFVPGGTGPDGYDCGGLTSASWLLAGYDVPTTPAGQWARGAAVPASQLQIGDLVLSPGGLDVGLYVGGGEVLGASAAGYQVGIRSLPEGASAVRVTLPAPVEPNAALPAAHGTLACGALPPPPKSAPTASPAWGGWTNGQIPSGVLCRLGVYSHALRCDAAADYRALSAAYADRFGERLCITDSYRSLSAQVTAFALKPHLAALPGTSNHGWALAVDLCGGVNSFGTPQWRWMAENAGRFGWVQPPWAGPRGEKPEPWHWEYGVIS